MPAIRVTRAHTADLAADVLAAARALMDEAFAHLPPVEAYTDDDWDHGLGGQHALAFDGSRLVGHGSLVQRRLLHGGRALRTGYVESLAVASTHRRQGVGSALMAALEALAPAYDLLALGTTEEGRRLYLDRGWVPWRGRLRALTPAGPVPCRDEEGWVLVLPGSATLDLDADLCCDVRDGDAW